MPILDISQPALAENTAADIALHTRELIALYADLRAHDQLSETALTQLIDQHIPIQKNRLLQAFRQLAAQGIIAYDKRVFEMLRMRPVRTISGVAPMAVLTGPYPCPAECIFCPDVKGMPRSYLPEEPGAQRAKRLRFDPYKQVDVRIRTLELNGHATDKIELLILGATWSAYPHKYQEWFIRRCLDAMNGFESQTLRDAQRANESAEHRAVGLVVETRPDYVTLDEVRRMRSLGVTKVQLGVQSLDDEILARNKRGHGIAQVRRAVRLLRLGGFKLHLHWMPNLLGATPQSDAEDFKRLWDDPAIQPDELKIYPCALIKETELYPYYERGEYRPYTDEELIELLVACKTRVPPYCRINRVVRDIPKEYIAAGSIASHLRVVVQKEMRARGLECQCIRCREVRGNKVDLAALALDQLSYATDATTEYFLQFLTPEKKIAGFLRLSLPNRNVALAEILDEIRGHALIREVHVYGPALEIGAASDGQAQHAGLGTRLIHAAEKIAVDAGFERLAVISAIGTRAYYRRLGFELGELYMAKTI
ncbi:MAG: tRNA uridine(34) 5-carboxymethylaminomethyl modification radical SAM/GNAT enzyme Elp3 [Chloroflexi bacterium]|nr:tRNA uridine(34) 5-carboxymethylaminomethyl modification radical SAM/GNAT enzyme Elp3 [Chloroflexota bacterium]